MWHCKWQLAERVWIARQLPRTAQLGWTQHGPRCYVHVHCRPQAGRQASSPGSLVCNIVAAYINWALQLI